MDCARCLGDAALPVDVDRHSRAASRSVSSRGRVARSQPDPVSQAACCSSSSRRATPGALVSRASRLRAPPSRRCCRWYLWCSCHSRSPVSIARWHGRTAEPPGIVAGDVRVTRSVPFSKADGVPLSLDVYQPPAKGPFPVIMQIYGGSWQNGTPASQEWFARYFARARLSGGGDRLSPRTGVEMARADRRRAHGAVLDLARRSDSSAATRAASCW